MAPEARFESVITTWSAFLPEGGSVVVVLTNRYVESVLEMGVPLVEAVRSD